MADRLINIPNDDTQNYPFCRNYNQLLKSFDTQINEPTNLNSKKPSQRIRKRYYKTFGTSAINSPGQCDDQQWFEDVIFKGFYDLGLQEKLRKQNKIQR